MISGQWQATKNVGACNGCNAPGFDLPSGRSKDPEFEVFVLNIAGTAPRLCLSCLGDLIDTANAGASEKV